MSLRRPSNLTYANDMATVAVFLALGGGAYAAFELPKGSVGSKQLKRGAVTPKKLAKATTKRIKGHKSSLKRAHNYGSPAPTVTDFFEEQSISAVLLGA